MLTACTRLDTKFMLVSAFGDYLFVRDEDSLFYQNVMMSFLCLNLSLLHVFFLILVASLHAL